MKVHLRLSLRCGFTLVEILVALAIITVFTAIAWPVFARVRNNGRRLTCSSNLMQIGQACMLYVADNNGNYPNISWTKAVDHQTVGSWPDRLLPYVRTPAIFECPSAKNCPYEPDTTRNQRDTGEVDEFGSFLTHGGGYDMNIPDTWVRYTRQSMATHPGSTISVLDGNGNDIAPMNAASDDLQELESKGLKPSRHQGGSNVLFLDWHVKYLRHEALADRHLWYLGTTLRIKPATP